MSLYDSIKVSNVKYHDINEEGVVYVGRPSILSNPYSTKYSKYKNVIKVSNKNIALEKYKEWLKDKIHNKDKAVINELRNILDYYVYNNFNIVLLCHCTNINGHGSCHAKILKDILISIINNEVKL